MAVMNKTLIIHHINDIDNIPAMERWFVHHHCPEVMAQEPWLTRYVMYRVMPPAKGMETMGFFNYRVHENLGLDVEGRRSLRGLLGMTPEPVENAMTVAIANIPAEPTEDFFGTNNSNHNSNHNWYRHNRLSQSSFTRNFSLIQHTNFSRNPSPHSLRSRRCPPDSLR